MTMPLKDRKVLLGITGGIAAYKSAELVRLLIKNGAGVKVVMTRNAARFITPLTLSSLSGQPVITDIFPAESESGIDHISNTDWADIFIIAPATANSIGKLASGIGDDALSTMALAFDGDFLIAPAMNSRMYRNPIVQENIKKLRSLGYTFAGPASGELACGYEDIGRMVEPREILEETVRILAGKRDLAGKKILITAGPTREAIDPVRYISNRSSGKMGYALAREAARRGADVILVSGPVSLETPSGVELIRVETAARMHRAVMENKAGTDAFIMAAAVADYRPEIEASSKIKKADETLNLKLTRTLDIAEELGRKKEGCFLIGFAAETDKLLENAARKLKSKGLDLIIANDVTEEGAGFDTDTNRVYIMDADGIVEETPILPKEEVAKRIIDVIKDRMD